MLEQTLQNLGLNENRTKVYLAILELKKASVLDLAKKTGILRTTIYDNIRFLKEMGLVSEVFEKKKRLFIAESPKNLINIIKSKETELKNILPDLIEKFETKKPEAKIKFYEGATGVKKMHDECLINKEKILWALGNTDILGQYVSESYTREFIKKRVRLKIQNRVLVAGDIEKHRKNKLFTAIENIKALREVRVAPISQEFAMFIMFFDNKVLFFAPKEEGYAFIFESQSFSQTIRSIFNALWPIAEPL